MPANQLIFLKTDSFTLGEPRDDLDVGHDYVRRGCGRSSLGFALGGDARGGRGSHPRLPSPLFRSRLTSVAPPFIRWRGPLARYVLPRRGSVRSNECPNAGHDTDRSNPVNGSLASFRPQNPELSDQAGLGRLTSPVRHSWPVARHFRCPPRHRPAHCGTLPAPSSPPLSGVLVPLRSYIVPDSHVQVDWGSLGLLRMARLSSRSRPS